MRARRVTVPSMSVFTKPFQSIVAACVILVGYSVPLHAQTDAASLLDSLRNATKSEAQVIDRDLQAHWSRSGSAAMDLLLRRGQKALDDQDIPAAIDHFTALSDHAPEFAEGWHGLARAYFAADLPGPALDALERALALNPKQYDAIFGLGVLLGQLGDFNRAAAAFEQTLALHPHHSEAQEALKRLQRQGIGRTL